MGWQGIMSGTEGALPSRRVEGSTLGSDRDLTYSPRKPAAQEEGQVDAEGPLEKRMLVVDDDRTIQGLFRDSLAHSDITVITAGTGEEALETLDREGFQVMFFDLNLPGINGVELCRRVRKDHPFACIQAMTGYASLFEFADCRVAGFDDYFIKPFHVATILDAVTEAFRKIERWEKLRTTWIA